VDLICRPHPSVLCHDAELHIVHPLERFPTLLNQAGRTENALDHCLSEHLYPTGDPVWSDDALAGC
jgi:hypothetical protein